MKEDKDYYKNYLSKHVTHLQKNDPMIMVRYYRKNYAKFMQNLDEDILDIGCGWGDFLLYLNEDGYRSIMGIDLSQECIDHCLDKGLGTPENLQKAGLEEFLASREETFDLIVLNDVIEHFPKEKVIDYLNLIRKALRKDGRVIVKSINCANPITGAASRYYDFTHTLGFTEESLAQVLRLADFERIELLPQDIWVFNPLVNLFGKFFQGVFNFLFRSLSLLYGRKTTHIFTKDLIAVGHR